MNGSLALHWQRHAKGRLAGPARDRQIPAMGLRYPVGDAKTEA
jgi:hypothetical protein